MALIANVALTDTFDVWRTRTNQLAVQSNSFETDIINLRNKSNNSPSYVFANNIGVEANTFASATIAGANTEVGAGANSYANVVWARANSRMDLAGVQANSRMDLGGQQANAYALSISSQSGTSFVVTLNGANTAIGAGANSYANVVWARANNRMDSLSSLTGTEANNFTIATLNGANTAARIATNLTSGTVPSARLSGSYTGITGVGTIDTGVWNATDISLAAGGTGATLTGVAGAVVYSGASAMALTGAGTSGQVLTSAGTSAPTWSNGLPVAQIPNAANLNTYTTPGLYHQSSDSQATAGTNYPAALSGLLEVHASSLMVYQRYTVYNSGRIYTRSSYNGSWYSWLTNLDSSSFNSFAPSLTGTSASGTWGISITGSAAQLGGVAAASYARKDTAQSYSGSITVTDGAGVAAIQTSGDIYAYRSGGTTGVLFLNAAGSRYIYNDGTNYVLPLGGLTVGGDITAFASDERLKKDIVEIQNPLDKLSQIRGVHYRHNDFALEQGLPDEAFVGVIAQEIEKVLPEVVTLAPFDYEGVDSSGKKISKSGENYKTVKYEKIVPLLIEAIKELTAKVEMLESRVKE
jgi:hypothetical protein